MDNIHLSVFELFENRKETCKLLDPRIFRNALYFLVGVMLSAVSILSYADTYTPAQSCTAPNKPGTYTSGQSACAAYMALPATQVPVYTFGGNPIGTPNCKGYIGGVFNSQVDVTCTASCPAGGTLSGTQCINAPVCPSGQARDPTNGQCVDSQVCYAVYVTTSGSCLKSAPCVPGQLPGIATTSQALCADNKPDPNSGCPPGGIVIGKNAAGKPLCLSPPPSDPDCTSAGGTIVGTIGTTGICSKSVNPKCADGSNAIGVANGAPVCQDTCPAGQATGVLNGVSSCWPVGKTAPGTASNKDSTTTNKPAGGSASTTGSTSTTVCTVEGSCTTTTVNTTNGVATGTSTTTQSQSDFCAANPSDKNCIGGTGQSTAEFCAAHPTDTKCVAEFCKTHATDPKCVEAGNSGQGTFGGSCGAEPACTGDAVQCAQATEVFKLRCQSDDLYKNPQTDKVVGVFDSDNPVGTSDDALKAGKALNKDGSGDFDIWAKFQENQKNYLNISGTCPASNLHFSFKGHDFDLSQQTDMVCQLGQFVKLLIHIMAYMVVLKMILKPLG